MLQHSELAPLVGCILLLGACSKLHHDNDGPEHDAGRTPPVDATAPDASAVAKALAQLEADTAVPWGTLVDPVYGAVSLLRPLEEPGVVLQSGDKPEDAARAFLEKYAAIFQIKDAANELVLESVNGPDELELTGVSFVQKEGAASVAGARLTLAFDASGRVAFVAGRFVPNLHGFATQPAIQAQDAMEAARADMLQGHPSGLGEPIETAAPELIVFVRGPAKLAYRLTLAYAYEADSGAGDTHSADYVVDANNGAILARSDAQKEAESGTVVQGFGTDSLKKVQTIPVFKPDAGKNYLMEQPATADQTAITVLDASKLTTGAISEASPGTMSMPGAWDAQGVDAYVNLRKVDAWWRQHQRNSYDGLGHAVSIIAHAPSAFENARWDGDHSIKIGDRFDPNALPYSVALDVIGHEFQHGVNQRTWASGSMGPEGEAIDESLGDIFGQFIEVDTGLLGTEATWTVPSLIGERADPAGIRNLRSPHLGGQPDSVGDPAFSGSNDSHALGGISNNAWWLTTYGGKNETTGKEIANPLTWADAKRLYLSLIKRSSIPSDPTFHDLAGGLVASASQLGADAQRTVACAWNAVAVLTDNELKTAFGIKSCKQDDAGMPKPPGCLQTKAAGDGSCLPDPDEPDAGENDAGARDAGPHLGPGACFVRGPFCSNNGYCPPNGVRLTCMEAGPNGTCPVPGYEFTTAFDSCANLPGGVLQTCESANGTVYLNWRLFVVDNPGSCS
ncbi:MAG: M4 family metallopeptidase [Myxococcales bacterium]